MKNFTKIFCIGKFRIKIFNNQIQNFSYQKIFSQIRLSLFLNIGVNLHSDRGVHYTNNVYQMLLKNNNILQSMSAPATPRDNAPIESFFGHLKDELDYKKCKTFEELSALVDDYMYNYNYTRKQWSKNKMTPIEYKNFLLVS